VPSPGATLEKFASIPPGTGLAALQEWASFIRGRIGLSWHDALIPIAMVVVVSVVSLQIRGRTDRRLKVEPFLPGSAGSSPLAFPYSARELA